MDFSFLIKNEYITFIVIVIGFFLLAKVIDYLGKIYVKRLTKRTKTDLDDIILDLVSRPSHYLINFLGLYLAVKSLSVLAKYEIWINRIFFVIAVLLVSMLVSRMLKVFIDRWLKTNKKFERIPQLLNKMIAVVVYIIAILMILSYLEVEVTPLIATLGLGGLAVGLALQNTLSNFFAGLHILSDKPINVGDFIELDGNVSGYVEDIGWRSTRIKTLPNTIIIVPNSKLAESTIINDSMPELEMAALVQVGVDYGSDLKKVEKVTIDVAMHIQKTVAGAVRNFEPFIRYHTFGDSNINFSVILRVEKFVDKYLVIHEFIKALKERYDKEGIEISWPVRKIHSIK